MNLWFLTSPKLLVLLLLYLKPKFGCSRIIATFKNPTTQNNALPLIAVLHKTMKYVKGIFMGTLESFNKTLKTLQFSTWWYRCLNINTR